MNPLDHVEAIAFVCHEANRAYCATIGEYSQPAWEDATDAIHESAMAGVRAIAVKPTIVPAELHESWCAHKMPCLVPYAELPVEQRRKDHLFGAIARTLIPVVELDAVVQLRDQIDAMAAALGRIQADGGHADDNEIGQIVLLLQEHAALKAEWRW